jgi:hypothetical protein
MDEYRTGNRGAMDRNRATKGILGHLKGRVHRFGNMEQSRERGVRGRETRSKAVRQGTEDWRQGDKVQRRERGDKGR